MITVQKGDQFNTYLLTAKITLGKLLILQKLLEQHSNNSIVSIMLRDLNEGLKASKIDPKTDKIEFPKTEKSEKIT